MSGQPDLCPAETRLYGAQCVGKSDHASLLRDRLIRFLTMIRAHAKARIPSTIWLLCKELAIIGLLRSDTVHSLERADPAIAPEADKI
jgi:hypothetical protein